MGKTISRQSGAILFVSLILLICVSLMGLCAAHASIMQARMVAGTRNMQLARVAADAALGEARARIEALAMSVGAQEVCVLLPCVIPDADFAFDPGEFMRSAAANGAAIPLSADWTRLHGIEESARLRQNPFYIVEDLGEFSGDTPASRRVHGFRILSQGFGAAAAFSRTVEGVVEVVQ